MALFAVLMGANLASCGSDFPEADNEEDIVTNERKLLTIAEEYEDGDLYTYSFSYDSKGLPFLQIKIDTTYCLYLSGNRAEGNSQVFNF